MSDGKINEQERYQNLKREVQVAQNCFQFLLQGKFNGASARELVVCQMWMQGLTKHLNSELEKIAPPVPVTPLESKEKGLEQASSNASELETSGAKQV